MSLYIEKELIIKYLLIPIIKSNK